MKRTVIHRALLAVSLFAALGCAQAAPDFSGEWKMNVVKSDFGQVPAPEVLTRTITHHDPSLEYKSYQKGAKGEVTSQIKYTTDGKPCVNNIQGTDTKGTARWQGDKLVIDSSLEVQGMHIASHDIWSLSDGGKTLTVTSHLSIPGQGEYDVKLVLDKQ